MLQTGNYEQKLVVIGIADLGHIANSEVIKNGSFSIHIAESEVVLITSAKEVMYSSSFVSLSVNGIGYRKSCFLMNFWDNRIAGKSIIFKG